MGPSHFYPSLREGVGEGKSGLRGIPSESPAPPHSLADLRGRPDRCGLGGLGKGPGPHRDEPSGEEPERMRQSERLLALALRLPEIRLA